MILKKYLKTIGMTQEAFAQKAGVTGTYIRYITAGARTPSRKLAKKMEALTNGEVTAIELLFPPEL